MTSKSLMVWFVRTAEMKKVFSMADTDNSGSIESSELKTVMKSLAGVEPSEAELKQVCGDHSGVSCIGS